MLCHFEYEHGPCPIYEEFAQRRGEMTFIEAWSNLPELLPHKTPAIAGPSESLNRLSTRVPGLGNVDGKIEPLGPWLDRAGKTDSDVADFALRSPTGGPTGTTSSKG